MSFPLDPELVLYGVVNFERRKGGGSGGLATIGHSRKARPVLASRSLVFYNDDGAEITVDSHLPVDAEGLEQMRDWAHMHTYLASPQGQAALADWDHTAPAPPPPEANWWPITVPVDGEDVSFEMCNVGDGWWSAFGALPDAVVIVGSQRVPISSVRLERLGPGDPPPPPLPYMGDCTETIVQHLADRFARVPFDRVRRWGDYWALWSVERDHVGRLASQFGLSTSARRALEDHWLSRIDYQLAPTRERLMFQSSDRLRNSRLARELKWNWLFQLWFNTLGPGARTWFGNRYAGIRHHTFRLRWRP